MNQFSIFQNIFMKIIHILLTTVWLCVSVSAVEVCWNEMSLNKRVGLFFVLFRVFFFFLSFCLHDAAHDVSIFLRSSVINSISSDAGTFTTSIQFVCRRDKWEARGRHVAHLNQKIAHSLSLNRRNNKNTQTNDQLDSTILSIDINTAGARVYLFVFLFIIPHDKRIKSTKKQNQSFHFLGAV